jgi:hypothetical protein
LFTAPLTPFGLTTKPDYDDTGGRMRMRVMDGRIASTDKRAGQLTAIEFERKLEVSLAAAGTRQQRLTGSGASVAAQAASSASCA